MPRGHPAKYNTFHLFNMLSFEGIATNSLDKITRALFFFFFFFFSKRDAFRESLIYEWFLSKGERGKLAHIFPRREEGAVFLRYLDNLSDPLSGIKRVLSLCANLIPFLFCLLMYAYADNTPRRRSRRSLCIIRRLIRAGNFYLFGSPGLRNFKFHRNFQ